MSFRELWRKMRSKKQGYLPPKTELNAGTTQTFGMVASEHEDITKNLHQRWEEIEKECEARGHKNRKEFWLNYCHIQRVRLCDECFILGQEEHQKLYVKLRKEGYRP